MTRLRKELTHNRIMASYNRFVPHQFLKLLEKGDITEVKLGDSVEKTMTILFSDIRDFTTLSENMTPRENFTFLNSYLKEMEPVIGTHKGIIDKYVGDAIMALFPTTADDALDGALEMLRQLRDFNRKLILSGFQPIAIGIGLNTGLMMLGTIGGPGRMEGTVISDAVNLASRVESMTKTYGTALLISEHTLYKLQKPSRYSIRFIDRVKVKGKIQPQSIYEVFDADPPARRRAKRSTREMFEEALAHYHFRQIPKAERLLRRCLRVHPDDSPARVYLERCAQFRKHGVHEGTGEIGRIPSWSDDLKIGEPDIDEQHRGLFRITADLLAAVRSGRGQQNIRPVLSSLDRCVSTHFQTEEDCMRQCGYPFYDVQKAQHERFVKYFRRLKKEIASPQENRLYLMFRMQILLVDWLVSHTSREDRHFGRFLRQRNVSCGI